MKQNRYLKNVLLIVIIFYLTQGVSAQNYNGGTADGFDVDSSQNYTTLLVSKFNGGQYDGYDTGMSVNYTILFVSKFNGGSYDGYDTGVSTNFSSGLISKFNGGAYDGYSSLNGVYQLSDTLLLGETVIENGDAVCFNATNYIEVPMLNTTFTVYSGGSVTLIAGEKISFKPGFTANPGSYVDAHITTDGSYCNIIMQPQLPNEKTPPPPEPDIVIIEGKTTDKPILVYPNPSSGLITIDLPETLIYENYRIEVYDYLGRLVKKKNIHDRKEYIDLSINQNGMYFIIIRNTDSIFRIKVIKM